MNHLPWEAIDGLEFWPWKGRNYECSDFGIRILVMGESTYYSDDDPELYGRQRKELGDHGPGCFAHYGILAYRHGKWNDGFHTKWVGALLGAKAECPDQRQRVVDNVAFWNYSDGKPLCGHGVKPRQEDLETANKKLRLVIGKLKPDLVILLSKRLWPNLSKGPDPFEKCTPDADLGTLCAQEVDGITTYFLSLPHPRTPPWRDAWKWVQGAFHQLRVQSLSCASPMVRTPAGRSRRHSVHRIVVRNPYGAWLFDDESHGIEGQPLVHSITDMVDAVAQRVPRASAGFALSFSLEPLDGCDEPLQLLSRPRKRGGGYLYRIPAQGLEGIICRSLERYFRTAPEKIYYVAEPVRAMTGESPTNRLGG